MVSEELWGSRSRRLAVLFLAVVVPPVAALIWLGVQLVDQDRALWTQREEERRQTSMRAVVLSLEQALTDAERKFADGPLRAGIVCFRVSSAGVQAEPANAVLWLPVPAPLPAADPRPFTAAESLEYRGQRESARQAYEALARAPQATVRAGAFLRLARVARQERRYSDALRFYDELSAIRQVALDGMPADLLARRAACSVLEEDPNRAALAHQVASLEADFLAGRWSLDRTRWELAAGEIARWTGHPLAAQREREAFSQVAQRLWTERQRHPAEALDQQLRRYVIDGAVPITVLERLATGDVTAIALAPAVVDDWARRAGAAVMLSAGSGRVVAGVPAQAQDRNVIRLSPAATGLPWTVTIVPTVAGPPSGRQPLLFLGLGAMALFVGGGTFLLWRVVQRELAVARLQTDFVAAVSHEFRTPLASLRHVTELLEEADDMPRSRRLSFYQSLSRNTERLHRLVESLLDFARMERLRKPYDMKAVDAATFARDVVEDFRREAEPRGYRVEFETDTEGAFAVCADRSSLVHALWNLLDNAVKYSPEPRPIRVYVGRHPRGVALSVQDHGIGVPTGERKEIFRKFVRGESAGRLGIKGTGLGLAMVAHIVDAHGGTVELESDEGAGSTFRIVLPAQG
jgi:signal transduction histidine kinase